MSNMSPVSGNTPFFRVDHLNFSPSEIVFSKAGSYTDTAFLLGSKERGIVHDKLKSLQHSSVYHDSMTQSSRYLDSLRTFAKSTMFVYGNVNYMNRYYMRVLAYAKGARITPLDTVLLQTEPVPGCQTASFFDKKTGILAGFHMEEIVNDKYVQDAQKILEEGSDSADAWKRVRHIPYRYRVVQSRTDDEHVEFFSYPYLCAGGPAFGINHAKGTLIFVDALYTKSHTDKPMELYANAVASIFFDAGSVQAMRAFMRTMRSHNIRVSDGYALHVVSTRVSSFLMSSFEFGSSYGTSVRSTRSKDIVYIAQTNYPRSRLLTGIDELYQARHSKTPNLYLLQQSYVTQGRRKRLKQFIRSFCHKARITPTGVTDILKMVTVQNGDVETTKDGQKIFTGYITPYLTGYAAWYLSRDLHQVVFGKYAPTFKGRIHSVHRWFHTDPGKKYPPDTKDIWDMISK